MHCAQEAKFSLHICLTCAEGLMYCSVHDTCSKRLFVHYGVALGSQYIPSRKKSKNTLITDTVPISVCFAFLICIHTEVE